MPRSPGRGARSPSPAGQEGERQDDHQREHGGAVLRDPFESLLQHRCLQPRRLRPTCHALMKSSKGTAGDKLLDARVRAAPVETATTATLVFAFTAWIASVALVALLFPEWTGSLFVSVPAAVCVATGAGRRCCKPTPGGPAITATDLRLQPAFS